MRAAHATSDPARPDPPPGPDRTGLGAPARRRPPWRAGLPFVQQYPACGRYLDFALLRDGLKLDVEVDGESPTGLRRPTKDRRPTRDLVLVADGWKVQRFWVYELREDLRGCVRTIRELSQANREDG